MKRFLFILWIFLLSVGFGLTKIKADVRMPMIFGDHMVLQQDAKIAIFGCKGDKTKCDKLSYSA